jgi:phosphate butyryltransferase
VYPGEIDDRPAHNRPIQEGGFQMNLPFSRFQHLLAEAEVLGPISVAVVEATERQVLEGAKEAADQHLIVPLLIGDEKRIRALARELDWGSDNFQIIPATSDEETAHLGVQLIADGQAQAIMKGHIHTDILLHPILAQLRKGRRLSHVFVAEMPSYAKLLFVTDGAINIAPDLLTKAAILQNAIDLVRLLGIDQVKAAALSAIETVNPNIPSTIEAACLSKMAERGQISGAIVDGPLAFDNAISAESARVKGIQSPVSGDVDIVLVPDLVSGNILAKDLEYLAGALLAGVVIGAEVPIILTSRADPPQARLASAALATIIYHRTKADDAKHDAPQVDDEHGSGERE